MKKNNKRNEPRRQYRYSATARGYHCIVSIGGKVIAEGWGITKADARVAAEMEMKR